ncbi:MAG: response regulator [Candidatus Limnocylindria bacterium]
MATATDGNRRATEERPVLIIDDDHGVRGVLAQILEDEGHAVRTATNGLDALEKLRGALKPCVILLDLMMPVMNGWEFMSQRQEEREIAAIPVVVISADQGARAKAEAIGAVDCLEKPIDLNRLIDTVDRYCAA